MKKGLILGLILSLAITGIACAKNPGEIAPDFTLNDVNGNQVTLSKIFSEKPVLLDFWATWCPACREEAPRVQAFYQKYADKVAVIGVDINESKKAITSFIEANGLTYPMVVDSGDVAQQYGVVGIPTIVLIDKGGKILYFGHSVHDAEKYLPL